MYDSSLTDVMGYREEMGARELVPQSYYLCELSVGQIDCSRDKGEDGGNTPFVPVGAMIESGPFEGAQVDGNIYLTPGKLNERGEASGYIAWINSQVQEITGQKPDVTAFGEAGIEFSNPSDGKMVRQEFAEWFSNATADERKAFMRKYCRTDKWNGKHVVCSIALQDEPMNDADTGKPMEDEHGNPRMRQVNRFKGFFNLNHPKHGKAFATKQFARQERMMKGEE